MNALSRKPRSMAEMLIEVTEQRNALARALHELLSALREWEAMSEILRTEIKAAHVAMAKVPSTVLLARKPE